MALTPEGRIKQAICEYLFFRRDVFLYLTPSVGIYDQKTKRYRRKNGKFDKKGVPDIQVILKVKGIPVSVGMEVKTLKGEQSADQRMFEAQMDAFGAWYFVVRSVLDADRALAMVYQDTVNKIKLANSQPIAPELVLAPRK